MLNRAVLPATFALALAGCVSLSPDPPESLLTLTATRAAPAGASVTGDAASALAVIEPATDQRLNVARVPVQVSDSSLAYLEDAVWVEKPARLFQRLLSETIRAGGSRLVVAEGDLGYTAANKLSGRLLEMGYDAGTGEVVVRYRDGARQVLRWQELDAPTAVHTDPTGLLQAGDVVWITGGLGGIGRILARWFGRIDGVRVLLSGRSPVGESGQQWLDAARQDGVDVTYLRCDVSRRVDVAAVLAGDAVQGRLRGIVHCAGTLRDAYLARKTPDEVQAVFAPKIDGTLNLDEATRDAVVQFQQQRGLSSDGQVDARTQMRLYEALPRYPTPDLESEPVDFAHAS